VKFIMVLQGTK